MCHERRNNLDKVTEYAFDFPWLREKENKIDRFISKLPRSKLAELRNLIIYNLHFFHYLDNLKID